MPHTTTIRVRRFSRSHTNGASGQTLILVAVALTSVLAMAALAIDVVTLYTFRSEAQRSADAAALAGAKLFVDSGFTSKACSSPIPSSLQLSIQQQATAIAQQNTVGGASASFAVNVSFPNAASSSCANPQVTVDVQRTNLPIYFARIWSRTLQSVKATATAEAYNPSAATSAGGGASAPVAPRCVKPLLLPNCDPTPGNTSSPPSPCAGGGGAATFVNPTTGAVSNPSVIGTTPGTPLTADCARSRRGSPCAANAPAAWQYYPLALPAATNACPNCSSSSSGFQNNLECCNPTPLACGQTLNVDFSRNPNGSRGAARAGGQCAIHQSGGGGQDWLDTSTSPFQMHAGSNNPFIGSNSQTNIQRGDVISSSNSIVTVPLYNGAPVAGAVTIVGFLQLFVKDVSNSGQTDATILNVIGCGQATGAPVLGAGSPIPVRLIHN